MANSLAHGPIQRLELASAHCPAGLFTPLVSARIWIGIQVSHSDRGYPLPTDSHSRAEGQFTGAWSHPATRTGLCALSRGPLHATGLGPHMDWDSSFAFRSRLPPAHRLPFACRGPIHWRMVFFNDSTSPEIYALSLHYSLPIWPAYGLGFKFRIPIEATPCPQTPIRVP